MKPRVLALFLIAAAAAYGAERDFDRLVGAIEHHYGVKRTHIPLLGVANLFLKVAHPAGASGFKLAIFEDLPEPDYFRDDLALDRFIENYCQDGSMHSLVVTHSRGNGESSYILTGEIGRNTKLLIATFERREATVIEAEVNMDALVKLLASPDTAHRMFRSEDEDRY